MTYLCPRNGTYSAIDLAFSSPSLENHLTWSVCNEQYGSDHFPIKLNFNEDNLIVKNYPRWIIDKANWEEFKNKINISTHNLIENIDEAVQNFTTKIIQAATDRIPKTKGLPKPNHAPWFDDECRAALKVKKYST